MIILTEHAQIKSEGEVELTVAGQNRYVFHRAMEVGLLNRNRSGMKVLTPRL